MNRFPVHGLYAVTPDTLDTAALAAMVSEAVAGGARLVQYRNKIASAPLRLEQAGRLLEICKQQDALLIVNDDTDLAVRIGAQGLHLGRDDGDIAAARARLPNAPIGASCYRSVDVAREAKRLGADYVAFGSFFASPTKPSAVRSPLSIIAEAKQAVGLPVVAIGGITLDNTPELITAGVDAIAVITALFGAPSVRSAAERFSALFSRMQA
jgi:thiamine-phosphate pyrophosphorylase